MVGCALMKMPRVLNAAYELSPFVQRNRDEVSRLRETLTAVNPATYRGIGRRPLSEIAEPDPGWVEATPPTTLATRDDKARRRLLLHPLRLDHLADVASPGPGLIRRSGAPRRVTERRNAVSRLPFG